MFSNLRNLMDGIGDFTRKVSTPYAPVVWNEGEYETIEPSFNVVFEGYYDADVTLGGAAAGVPLKNSIIDGATFTHASGASVVTIRKAGTYLICASASGERVSSQGIVYGQIVHNGTLIPGALMEDQFTNAAGSVCSVGGKSRTIVAAANDTVEFQAWKFGGGAKLLADTIAMTIIKLAESP